MTDAPAPSAEPSILDKVAENVRNERAAELEIGFALNAADYSAQRIADGHSYNAMERHAVTLAAAYRAERERVKALEAERDACGEATIQALEAAENFAKALSNATSLVHQFSAEIDASEARATAAEAQVREAKNEWESALERARTSETLRLEAEAQVKEMRGAREQFAKDCRAVTEGRPEGWSDDVWNAYAKKLLSRLINEYVTRPEATLAATKEGA
jgi:chromosome segregation ATPase